MTPQVNIYDLDALPEPVAGGPAPDRVLAGDPRFLTWELERDEVGRITSGIWEASPGAWFSSKDGVWEFATLLSGVVELAEEGKPARTLKAGDSFVLRPDFRGTWNVLETARKAWVIRAA